jgi:hypothetical protein
MVLVLVDELMDGIFLVPEEDAVCTKGLELLHFALQVLRNRYQESVLLRILF